MPGVAHTTRAHAPTHKANGVDRLTPDDDFMTDLLRLRTWGVSESIPGALVTATGSGEVYNRLREMIVRTGDTSGSTARLRSATTGAGWQVGVDREKINWSKRMVMHITMSQQAATTNGVGYFALGKGLESAAAALSTKGIGISIADDALSGQCHDGTSLDTVSLGTTLTIDELYSVVIISDGEGNVEWLVNEVSKGKSSGGPTGLGESGDTRLQLEVGNGADSADQQFRAHIIAVFMGV